MPINVDLLKRALRDKFGSVERAIRELDYGDFTKNAFKTGTLKKQYVDALEQWGVRYEDYANETGEDVNADNVTILLTEISNTLLRIEQMLR